MFLMVPPFSEWINWGTSSHISELILEGTFLPPEVNSLTSELLQHMKRHASLDQIQDTLTTTEWIGKISAWPESMSTSPSGFHLTHSKALVAKHDRIPSTTPGAEPPRDAKDSSSARSHTTHLQTSSSNRP